MQLDCEFLLLARLLWRYARQVRFVGRTFTLVDLLGELLTLYSLIESELRGFESQFKSRFRATK